VVAGTRELVLLKHGEVYLKGRNRDRFERQLRDNLRYALRGVGGSTWIRNGQNVTVLGGEVPVTELVERARRVFGFSVIQPALGVPSTVEDITATCIRLLRAAQRDRPGLSFAVRPRRRDKDFALTSMQLAVEVGAAVQRELGLPVNLSKPDVEVAIEVERSETYVTTERLAGRGGLPVGASGRALVLLSGGFDSPVAAYRAMRRGLRCEFVHFTGAPYTGPSSTYKAYALVRELNQYQPAGKVHVIPLGAAQKQLSIVGAGRYQVVAQRRLMVRAATALAHQLGAQALVTGDSLGQVASQTLSNLAAVEAAVEDVPLLRPLIGWDKEEIIAEARSIGTAQISVLPDEDCCQLLAPRHASTFSPTDRLDEIERRLDVGELVEQLLSRDQPMLPG
jgi:thiamine biosynthesis protein ThiI